MPPVMGIAAFVMAEFLRVPYAEVALAATIPAILFYIALFIQVDLEAARSNIRPMEPEQIPKSRDGAEGRLALPDPVRGPDLRPVLGRRGSRRRGPAGDRGGARRWRS